jgi:hypothetical protein
MFIVDILVIVYNDFSANVIDYSVKPNPVWKNIINSINKFVWFNSSVNVSNS